MEKEEDVFGGLAEIDVAPPHGDEGIRDDQRQASLERLEDGDGSEASAVRVASRNLLPAYSSAAAHGLRWRDSGLPLHVHYQMPAEDAAFPDCGPSQIRSTTRRNWVSAGQQFDAGRSFTGRKS